MSHDPIHHRRNQNPHPGDDDHPHHQPRHHVHHRDAHPGQGFHPRQDAYPDPNAHPHQDAHPDPNAHPHQDAHPDPNAHPHQDAYPDPNGCRVRCRFWVWQDRRCQYGADRYRPHAPLDASCHRDAGQANPRDQHPVSSEEHQEHHFPAPLHGYPTWEHDHPARCSHPENASAATQPPAPAHDQEHHRAGSARHHDAPTTRHARLHPHARPRHRRYAQWHHHCFQDEHSPIPHHARNHHHNLPRQHHDARSDLRHDHQPTRDPAPVNDHGTATRPPPWSDLHPLRPRPAHAPRKHPCRDTTRLCRENPPGSK